MSNTQSAFDDGEKLPAFTRVGGYPIVYLDEKERVLCAGCATEHMVDEGGTVTGDVLWEGGPVSCDACGEEVVSAYGGEG